jgi:hypothetical protein
MANVFFGRLLTEQVEIQDLFFCESNFGTKPSVSQNLMCNSFFFAEESDWDHREREQEA